MAAQKPSGGPTHPSQSSQAAEALDQQKKIAAAIAEEVQKSAGRPAPDPKK